MRQLYFFSKNGWTMLSTHGLWLAAPPITISFACARTIEAAATNPKAAKLALLSAARRVISPVRVMAAACLRGWQRPELGPVRSTDSRAAHVRCNRHERAVRECGAEASRHATAPEQAESMSPERTELGWLGRQDSNLGMAESK